MAHAPGTVLSHYEIRSLLGKGGMGEVYLALDRQDGSLVALKLLHAELATDLERLRRFSQEAFVTTTLDSDYFIKIYEIGQAGAFPFLAMEYVEGVTLRQHLRLSQMSVDPALGLAAQLAEALLVAHESGIVHRDIKPENIMLRYDGSIKVLDLGLAKLTEAFHHRLSTPDAQTVTHVSTGEGAVIGTINYMSPEQLRSLPVDERTDIWSFGVVLHEMLTSGLPFRGHTPEEVVVSILEREPPPLAQFRSDLPAGLELVTAALLQKDRERRYQTAREVLSDLKELSGNAGGSAPPAALHAARVHLTEDIVVAETAPTAEATETQFIFGEGEAGDTRVTAPLKHGQRKLNAVLASLLLATLVGMGFLGYRAFVAVPSVAAVRFMRLEMPGEAREAALSPDGKHVAAVLGDAGRQSIMLRDLATSTLTPIVGAGGGDYMGLSFSPDGRYVYYLEKGQETGTLFRVPGLGGVPEKLLDNVNTPVTFSPRGERIAYVRYDIEEQTTVLMTAHADGTGERVVATRRPPSGFTLGGFRSSGPAWSPDGRVIACPVVNTSGAFSTDLVAVNPDDGTERRINAGGWMSIERVVWLGDGSGLVMNATDVASAPYQLWFLSYVTGEARRITNDPNAYDGVSASSDFALLLTIKAEQLSTVWLLNAGDMSSARQLPNSKSKGSNGILWAPDNRLVYTTGEDGDQSLWRMGFDGNGPELLTNGPGMSIQPAMSGDGRLLAFVSYKEGVPHVWLANAEGARLRQLTDGPYEDTPQLTPDGRWVVYHSTHPGRDSVWRTPVNGGAPELLSRVPALHPVVSPDGNTIAALSHDERSSAPWRIALMPANGGEPFKRFDLPAPVDVTWPALRWAPNGRVITYVATVDGVSNIWQQPLDGRPPDRLTDFKEGQIFSFAWSPDGRQLACVRGRQTSDLVLISGFR